MRALVQRACGASVSVDGSHIASIGPGLLVLLGITHEDDEAVTDRLAQEVLALRIFGDSQGKMNEPLSGREILCVSQFTLYADSRHGNRPGFTAAAGPEQAKPLYERFCARTGAKQGRFGAHMRIDLQADGPVTLMLEAHRQPSTVPDR